MLLRTRGFMYPIYIKLSKRLLSTQIKEVLDTRLDPPCDISENQLQLSAISKNLNALNLDFFVNKISQHEDKSSAILDLLANLRATKFANTCLESTQFAVVGHLLENLTIQEVVSVLQDRLKYGIFLNNFTAFAVTQMLHAEKEYILGLPLAMKLIVSGEVDSVFVQAFCLKAALETLKKELDDTPSEDKDLTPPPKKGKVQEQKVRVKFIRNVTEPNVHNEIGKAILKVKSTVLETNARENVEIMGFVLTKNYAKLDDALSVKSIEINGDIADICRKFLLRENQTDYADKIEKLQSKALFGKFIDAFLKDASEKEVVPLSEKQKQLFPVWQQMRAQKKLEFDEEVKRRERTENIEAMRNEIATKKDLLWFFDNEDKFDLEIHNKQVFYPKRWFGKKKKPRVIDEHYVPPEIRRI